MSRKLSDQIREFGQDKRERYKEYQGLLDQALQAGAQAVLDMPRTAPVHGAVWVRLNDGRSAFARFLQETGNVRPAGKPGAAAQWVRGNRKMGTHLPAELGDSGQAMAWAEAVREVLAPGGVAVTIGHDFITGP